MKEGGYRSDNWGWRNGDTEVKLGMVEDTDYEHSVGVLSG